MMLRTQLLTGLAALAIGVCVLPAHAADNASARWQREADNVTITRDDWGIPHIHGDTDADAVFGMIYAQAEDDFNRVETNYLDALGWRARAEGRSAIWKDLRMRLFIGPDELKAKYADSPDDLKELMDAWADGLNYFLATHPDVHPKVIQHFRPWMALAFSEGSIGGDITRISLDDLAAFYGDEDAAPADAIARTTQPGPEAPTGSNGIAIDPKHSADGNALLLINPHVTFYFRTEAQISSDEGLDAYGASTWGQFFIYQGFNKHLGWMHTSTGADSVDEFAETVQHKDGQLQYRHGDDWQPVETRNITVPYKTDDGDMAKRTFTAYYTQHGPVVRKDDAGHWITTALMQRPVKALRQSWLRTKATNLAEYRKASALQANSSNNTIYADDQGHIGFFMPQFIPARDNDFDYTQPVDGSDPDADWQGPTPIDAMPDVLDPHNGWVMNTNDWPWSAAGTNSPDKSDYPAYMDTFGENPRGVHATQMLKGADDFSLPKLISLAFDSRLPAFQRLLPVLVDDYDQLDADTALHDKLAGPISLLRDWNYRWRTTSIATTLAVLWGDKLWRQVADKAADADESRYDYIAGDVGGNARLQALADVVDRLQDDFGHWGVAWGQVNRYQRVNDRIKPHFDDDEPSLPVPFVSSRWGSLASFGAHRPDGSKHYHGYNGNSFVAVVDFGDRVHARAIHVGGQSGHPDSPHFTDQAERYLDGNLRQVYFWPDELKGHVEARYHPGEHTGE